MKHLFGPLCAFVGVRIFMFMHKITRFTHDRQFPSVSRESSNQYLLLVTPQSFVHFTGCTVFAQNYVNTVRVKELDSRTLNSFDIFTVTLLDVTVVLQLLP